MSIERLSVPSLPCVPLPPAPAVPICTWLLRNRDTLLPTHGSPSVAASSLPKAAAAGGASTTGSRVGSTAGATAHAASPDASQDLSGFASLATFALAPIPRLVCVHCNVWWRHGALELTADAIAAAEHGVGLICHPARHPTFPPLHRSDHHAAGLDGWAAAAPPAQATGAEQQPAPAGATCDVAISIRPAPVAGKGSPVAHASSGSASKARPGMLSMAAAAGDTAAQQARPPRLSLSDRLALRPWQRSVLAFVVRDVLQMPSVGAALGLLIGCVAPLKHLFFPSQVRMGLCFTVTVLRAAGRGCDRRFKPGTKCGSAALPDRVA